MKLLVEEEDTLEGLQNIIHTLDISKVVVGTIKERYHMHVTQHICLCLCLWINYRQPVNNCLKLQSAITVRGSKEIDERSETIMQVLVCPQWKTRFH
jgi:hypothetical protein